VIILVGGTGILLTFRPQYTAQLDVWSVVIYAMKNMASAAVWGCIGGSNSLPPSMFFGFYLVFMGSSWRRIPLFLLANLTIFAINLDWSTNVIDWPLLIYSSSLL
jgi:hypothetical protein